jgi:hypothetical protein
VQVPENLPPDAAWNEERERFEWGPRTRSGQRDGEWRAWDAAGVLRESARWVDGVRHGVMRTFDEGGGLREEGAFEDDLPTGVWRTFDEFGRLLEEASWRAGVRHGVSRRFDASGACVDFTTWAQGLREGVRRLGPVRGRYARDVPVGDWEYLGAHDVVLRTASVHVVDEGEVLRSGDTPATLRALATKLLGTGRTAEALVASARAGGQTGDISTFVVQLAEYALPFTSDDAVPLSEHVTGECSTLRGLMAGLVMGLHAPTVLRALARQLAMLGRPRVALELLNAAVLLTPRDAAAREARAELLLELWLPALLEADFPKLPDDVRARLAARRDLGATPFTFAAALAVPRLAPGGVGGLPRLVVQPVDAVRAAVSVSARRLTLLQQSLAGVVELPDVSRLAPAEELPEGAGLDVVGLSPLAALELAQAEWRALCWMCWACGLDEVGLPTGLASRLGLGAALEVHEKHCRALAARAPADAATEAGVRVGLEPLARLRWLTTRDAASPWAADLRDI